MINAIYPLSIRLQMEMPGTMGADLTLQEARGAVDRVMKAVEEVRAVARQKAESSRQKAVTREEKTTLEKIACKSEKEAR